MEGTFTFFSVGPDEHHTPDYLLETLPWRINPWNGPYLADKGEPAPPDLLPAEELDNKKLPEDWTAGDSVRVIGDLEWGCDENSDVIVASTSYFKEAQKEAKKLGYRPAKLGEYIQLLVELEEKSYHSYHETGWYYCYEGRKPGYATLAYYNDVLGKVTEVIFDTKLPDLVYVSSNSDNHCFFIRS